MSHSSPKPITSLQRAIILHTFGVQVVVSEGFQGLGMLGGAAFKSTRGLGMGVGSQNACTKSKNAVKVQIHHPKTGFRFQVPFRS